MSLVSDALNQLPDRELQDTSLRNPYEFTPKKRLNKKWLLLSVLFLIVLIQLGMLLISDRVHIFNKDVSVIGSQSLPAENSSIQENSDETLLNPSLGSAQLSEVAQNQPTALAPQSKAPQALIELSEGNNGLVDPIADQDEKSDLKQQLNSDESIASVQNEAVAQELPLNPIIQQISREDAHIENIPEDNIEETPTAELPIIGKVTKGSSALVSKATAIEVKPNESNQVESFDADAVVITNRATQDSTEQVLAKVKSLVSEGKVKDATELLVQALSQSPDKLIIRLNLVKLYLTENEPEKAWSMIESEHGIEAVALKGLIQEKMGHSEMAINYYRQLGNKGLLEPGYQLRYAVLLENSNSLSQAKYWYQQVAVNAENSVSVREFAATRFSAITKAGL